MEKQENTRQVISKTTTTALVRWGRHPAALPPPPPPPRSSLSRRSPKPGYRQPPLRRGRGGWGGGNGEGAPKAIPWITAGPQAGGESRPPAAARRPWTQRGGRAGSGRSSTAASPAADQPSVPRGARLSAHARPAPPSHRCRRASSLTPPAPATGNGRPALSPGGARGGWRGGGVGHKHSGPAPD